MQSSTGITRPIFTTRVASTRGATHNNSVLPRLEGEPGTVVSHKPVDLNLHIRGLWVRCPHPSLYGHHITTDIMRLLIIAAFQSKRTVTLPNWRLKLLTSHAGPSFVADKRM